jgi:hypothetical protein
MRQDGQTGHRAGPRRAFVRALAGGLAAASFAALWVGPGAVAPRAAAQEEPPPPPAEERPPAAEPKPAPDPGPERDPFETSPEMLDEARRRGTAAEFLADEDPDDTPELRLRGFVEGEDGQSVALLEVGGKDVYIVRKDDTVSLHTGRRSVVLRVMEVGHLRLVVELGRLRRAVVVR